MLYVWIEFWDAQGLVTLVHLFWFLNPFFEKEKKKKERKLVQTFYVD